MKFKTGAASFYIIAFSTLILLTIAMSFAAVMISQITRTSNSDLSQSAYDSAMAGVEDAKLAFYNYQDCLDQGKSAASGLDKDGILSCEEIIYLVEESNDCDTVGYVLRRFADTDADAARDEGVLIKEEVAIDNNMAQAYTCVKMLTSLDSYDATLSSSNPIRIIKAKFDGIDASDIEAVQISWYSDKNVRENGPIRYTNFDAGENVKFITDNFANRAMPPTISLGMVQTAVDFNFGDFDVSRNGMTNRGMVYLVPAGNPNTARNASATYIGTYNTDSKLNILAADAMAKSNDKTVKNLPYGVYCPNISGVSYLCTATVNLPSPLGGNRSNDTFMFVVALPYGKPTTDISLRFLCKDSNTGCNEVQLDGVEGSGSSSDVVVKRAASLKGVQIGVDSTGRANDLYRRVEVRMDIDGASGGGSLSSILGPLELSGSGDGSGSGGDGSGNESLKKSDPVTCEYDFDPTCW